MDLLNVWRGVLLFFSRQPSSRSKAIYRCASMAYWSGTDAVPPVRHRRRRGLGESTRRRRAVDATPSQVYRAYSRSISEAIAAHGDLATRHQDAEHVARPKERSYACYRPSSRSAASRKPPRLVAESFVPPLLEPVLEDYAQAVPAARFRRFVTLSYYDR